MKYKIIVDSSSNLLPTYLSGYSDIGFAVAPLTIRFNGKEYIDDASLDVGKMLKELSSFPGKATTACPSPGDYLKEMKDAEYYILITISSKLSGSYQSACLAKEAYAFPDNVLVIDSKLVCGTMEQLVLKAVEEIQKGTDFETLKSCLFGYRDTLNLLFVLNRFDNLIKNGRMNRVTALIAQLIGIKPLCYGDGGEIKIKEKVRTIQGVFKRLVVNIGKMGSDFEQRMCIISHTEAPDLALTLKNAIQERYPFKEIKVVENRGLAAFYSLEGGIICCF